MSCQRLHTFFLLFIAIILAPSAAFADAIGTWKLYSCYSDVKDIQPAGSDIFVLASGNLYSYNINDNSLTTYDKTTCLNGSNITNIAWVQTAKQLVITYSDSNIDLLSPNLDVTSIGDLANKQMTGDKTINDIYVSGKFAYISTGFGIIKLNVSEAYIADSYNLGYEINYCYTEGGYIYGASKTKGLMRASLSSNLLDKSNWQRAGNYSPKQKTSYTFDTRNNFFWEADAEGYLTRYKNVDGKRETAIKDVSFRVKPDGPAVSASYRMCIDSGILYMSAGGCNVDVAAERNGDILTWDGTNWGRFENKLKEKTGHSYIDINTIAVNPTNRNITAACGRTGLYIFDKGALTAHYDCSNSPITSAVPKDREPRDWNIIQSLTYDSKGNLWLANYFGTKILCLKNDGEWEEYDQSALLVPNFNVGLESFLIDSRGCLWFCGTRWEDSRIFCYDIAKDKLKRYNSFTNQDGTSYVPYLHCLAEDKDGNIWIGGHLGPFYIKSDDIRSGEEIMTQHKVPRNDGTNLADYLLSNINVNCITIDAANRKWIGTLGSGVFVISSDCNTQENHFSVANSPILSDNITDIKIDEKSGLVYIATDNGVCSYQSDNISHGSEASNDNIYAYPNPVTPDYTGPITIVGMESGSQIIITTASGQKVAQGTCSGGSFRWNGCDLNGNPVASGVYMALIANANGEKSAVTKIAIIR